MTVIVPGFRCGEAYCRFDAGVYARSAILMQASVAKALYTGGTLCDLDEASPVTRSKCFSSSVG